MAAVTAVVLVGSSHPNEPSIDCRWVLKLWEGDRASWTAETLGEVTNRRQDCDSPDDIAAALVRLVESLPEVGESPLASVAIMTLPNSSLASMLDEVTTSLKASNLFVFTEPAGRTRTAWD